MSAVLIHAGMPKTGSSSIQSWLLEHASVLASGHGIHLVQHTGRGANGIALEAFRGGMSVVANGFVLRYAHALESGDAKGQAAAVDEFVRQLDGVASVCGTALLTAEGLAGPIATADPVFLAGMERLGGRHQVRIAYYVRPQDTALEARWRQWGYGTGIAPSDWISQQLPHLRYWSTLEAFEETAPSVRLEVRPYRRDLLEDSDVVVDFARRFLGVDLDVTPEAYTGDPSLPLDLANLLRPTSSRGAGGQRSTSVGHLGGGIHQMRLGARARKWAVPASPEVERSREVLRAFAHRSLEPANQQLIRRLGWTTDWFVPPPADGTSDDPAELDELWSPRASPTAMAYLRAAVDEFLHEAPSGFVE